jgi:hypothetical protein
VTLIWIGQQYSSGLQLDLASGTYEPCYPNYASWTAVAKSPDAVNYVKFHSKDCTGPAYAPFGSATRFKVAGVLQEARGPLLPPVGLGTGEPVSYYNGDTCKDISDDGPIDYLQSYLGVLPEFKAAFTNPPYSVKIVY